MNYRNYTTDPIVGDLTETITLPADFKVTSLQIFDRSGELYTITTVANPDLVVWIPPGGVTTYVTIDAADTIQLVHTTTHGADKTSGFRALTIYGVTV